MSALTPRADAVHGRCPHIGKVPRDGDRPDLAAEAIPRLEHGDPGTQLTQPSSCAQSADPLTTYGNRTARVVRHIPKTDHG